VAATSLAIHVPPEANPTNVAALVCALAREPERTYTSVQELLEFANEQNIGMRTEMQHTATKLGLIHRADGMIRISPDGLAFASIKEDARGDILHFLMYSSWSEGNPLEFLPSWSYRTCCDLYWRTPEVHLTDNFLDQLVEEVINEAEITFHRLGFTEIGTPSFSRKSLSGVHNWLSALNPTVIEDKQFSRRAFCSPELLLLAIGYVMKDVDGATDTDILLSREKRDAICRLCLLEPEALDRALDWMIPIYPNVIKPGTSAGYYGRFVRLMKIPTLADVVR